MFALKPAAGLPFDDEARGRSQRRGLPESKPSGQDFRMVAKSDGSGDPLSPGALDEIRDSSALEIMSERILAFARRIPDTPEGTAARVMWLEALKKKVREERQEREKARALENPETPLNPKQEISKPYSALKWRPNESIPNPFAMTDEELQQRIQARQRGRQPGRE